MSYIEEYADDLINQYLLSFQHLEQWNIAEAKICALIAIEAMEIEIKECSLYNQESKLNDMIKIKRFIENKNQ